MLKILGEGYKTTLIEKYEGETYVISEKKKKKLQPLVFI